MFYKEICSLEIKNIDYFTMKDASEWESDFAKLLNDKLGHETMTKNDGIKIQVNDFDVRNDEISLIVLISDDGSFDEEVDFEEFFNKIVPKFRGIQNLEKKVRIYISEFASMLNKTIKDNNIIVPYDGSDLFYSKGYYYSACLHLHGKHVVREVKTKLVEIEEDTDSLELFV